MEKIKNIITWWQEFDIPEFIPRFLDPHILKSPLVPVLVGPRKSGKSTLFFQIISELKHKVPESNLFYINFDDDRLLPLTGQELSVLFNVYRQFVDIDSRYPVYFFLDEIQNVPNWEKSVRRLAQAESSLRLYITGSNSKLLSSDIATSLRGQTLSFHVRPLSFREYLKFKNIKIETEKLQYSGQKDIVLYHFNTLLKYGGFPQVSLLDDDQLKQRILQEYFATIFFADIVERYEIRQVRTLDTFIKILARQMSCLFSVGKLADSMGSIGFKVSKTTLIEYLGYIEEAFLGKAVSIHSYSVKDQLQYPRKFYLIDNGLYSAASFVKSDDWGRLLENLVFTVLERRYDSIFYWKNTKGYEVDFVLPDLFDRSNEYPLIQVCYSVRDNETLKREIRSLLLAAKEFRVHRALLITRDQWDHLTEQGIEIKLLPFIQWALNME